MRELITGVVAALAAVLLLLAGLALAGFAPGAVLATAATGIAGSPTRVAIWFGEAVPLLLCGLAAGTAFRAGVLNIGGEGQFLLGAVTAVAVATTAPPGIATAWLALAAAAGAGAVWCGGALAFDRVRGVPLVLSTILLNVIAAHVVGMLVEGPLRDPTTSAPQSALVPDASRLTALVGGTGLHAGAFLALGLAIALWLVQRRTAFGFAATVVGLNPVAADLAGISVTRHQAIAALASGALAGLAGGSQVVGVAFFLSGSPVSYGYAGIAVALLGRLHPLGIVPAALFFAGLDLSARQLERRMGIPHDLGDLAKGIAVALVLVAGSLATRKGRA